MKKRFHHVRAFSSISLLFCATLAFGNPELDRKYALESIGFLKSWDNVDGLFTEYVQSAYTDYFSKESRFIVQELTQADTVLYQSKIPYQKLIMDADVLKQVIKIARVESLLRTRIYKEGPQYRFVVDWLHSQSLDLLTSHTFYYQEPENGTAIGSEVLKAEIEKGLSTLVSKVPFYGHVTGVDSQWITVNIGKQAKLTEGDILEIGTLEGVKKHPLLNSVVEWLTVPTGKLVVHTIDEKITFCKVLELADGHQISRYQKVVRLIPKPMILTGGAGSSGQQVSENGDPNLQMSSEEKPKLGFAAITTALGSLSRQYSNGTNTKSGGGLLFGFKGEAQLWLTRDFFADLSYLHGFSSYSQEDITSGAGTGTSLSLGSASLSKFKFDVGYNYFIEGALTGPRLYAKLGIQTTSYSLPANTTELVGSASFTSTIFAGIGGDLPLRDRVGILVEIDLGILRSVTETGFTNGAISGTQDFSVFVGGYYLFGPKMRIRAGFEIYSQGADFANASFTNKAVLFAPSLLYYF
jgi:hypothetical protein